VLISVTSQLRVYLSGVNLSHSVHMYRKSIVVVVSMSYSN